MFVVFEGIDGSGKTTVSNRVARRLRARGVSVEHVREDGQFASPLVTRLRELSKDTRNLAMAPLTELLLYLARDAQLLAEHIHPALERSEVVLADRYLYSHTVLAHDGRGLQRAQVQTLVEGVAAGMRPALVVLLDADPCIARARRKTRKLGQRAAGEPGTSGSRKGLAGAGMPHRMRAGYLALAARDPARWLVVDNSGSGADLDATVVRVADAIESLLAGQSAAPQIRAVEAASGPRIAAAAPDLDAARAAFYRAVEAYAAREPAVAAYLLAGLDGDGAYAWRDRLLCAVPHVVAYGLRGLGDERAWSLRERLARTTPPFVARSLAGARVEGTRAEAMRLRFLDAEPRAVLSTLSGTDGEAAWAVRDRLTAALPREVVASLHGLEDERAWRLRDDYAAAHGGGWTPDPHAIGGLVQSLRGLGGERAWSLRRRHRDACPAAVLRSLAGLDDDEAWHLRAANAWHAPKIVLGTIDGSSDPRAWALRALLAPRVKEALDSMVGLDGDEAWRVREASADCWPSTTVKSLGELVLTPRGAKLTARLLAAHADNISLLKHATRAATLRDAKGGVSHAA